MRVAEAKRSEVFYGKYGSREAGLAAGCECLFSLNRFVKGNICSVSYRKEIRQLKKRVIQLLYEEGYSVQCLEQYRDVPALECMACEGAGIVDPNDSYPCRTCAGTGLYKSAVRRTFVCFRFLIDGKAYCWHQPKENVRFQYATTAPPSVMRPVETATRPIKKKNMMLPVRKREEQVVLSLSFIEEGLELLRWILSQAPEQRSMAA